MFGFQRFVPQLVVFVLLAVPPIASAMVNPHIELIEVWRNTTINAELAVVQTYPDDGELLKGANRRYQDGGELWGSEQDDIGYPLGISLPSSAGYAGNGNGRVSQSHQLDIGSIAVQQVADVNVTATGDSFNYEISGQGGAYAEARYRFVLHGDALARLDMDSTVNLYRDDNVRFSLTRELESGKIEILWLGAIDYDDKWAPIRRFSRKLEMSAGTYQLTISTLAHSTLSGSDQRAENSQFNAALVVVGPLCECCRNGGSPMLSKQAASRCR